jgi:DNA-binding beta-propeller fold protein YncE
MLSVLRTAVLDFLLLVLFCASLGNTRAADPDPPLLLERRIPLADVSGRIDHMAVDLRRQRLFVAELGNGTIDVIDLTTGKTIHRINGLREPQGIGYAAKADMFAVASAGDGSVRLFRGENFAPAGTVDLGEDADNVRTDSQTGNLVVGYGSGGLAVIDPPRRSIVSRTELPAHPEGFQLDPTSRRAFVNLPNAHQVAVVNVATVKQVANWRVPGLRANFPMALDDQGAVIATVFRNPPRLVLLDANSGVVTINLETCGDADDVFFDSRRHRIYVSCGEGSVDVLEQGSTGYHRLSLIETASGARTSLFVPELDRLFVVAPARFFGFGSDAAILVFRPHP